MSRSILGRERGRILWLLSARVVARLRWWRTGLEVVEDLGLDWWLSGFVGELLDDQRGKRLKEVLSWHCCEMIRWWMGCWRARLMCWNRMGGSFLDRRFLDPSPILLRSEDVTLCGMSWNGGTKE